MEEVSNKIKKALIYCRVSTTEQAEGYSLDAQEKFCRRFTEGNGYQIAGVYRDEGKSGTNLNRPALQDLLSKCQEDKSISGIIVQETDRLARNTKDHLTIRAILQKAGVKLISVAQPMLDDSPEGNMIDTILASVNQFQSDINSRKTKKGLQEYVDSVHPDKVPPEKLYKKLHKPVAYVVTDNDKIVGIIRGTPDRINSLFVDGKYQKQGIGKKLVEFFVRVAKKQNVQFIKVRSSVFAVSFYEAMGFKKTTGLRQPHGMKMYNMKKVL